MHMNGALVVKVNVVAIRLPFFISPKYAFFKKNSRLGISFVCNITCYPDTEHLLSLLTMAKDKAGEIISWSFFVLGSIIFIIIDLKPSNEKKDLQNYWFKKGYNQCRLDNKLY